MKITLLVLFLFCTVAAFSQSAPVLSSQPSIAQFTEHPEHAEPHAMAAEQPDRRRSLGLLQLRSEESSLCGSSDRPRSPCRSAM